jgi:DNA polymerase-3 subunit beta
MTVKVTVNNSDIGDAETNMACQYNGPDMNIGWNTGYLNTILKSFGNNADLTMTIEAPNSPSVITSADKPEFDAVIMPMRV